MNRVYLHPNVQAALRVGCRELGGHALTALLDRAAGDQLPVDQDALEVIRDYVRRIEDHLRAKYPHYDDEEEGYDPEHEDASFDAMDAWRNKLVLIVANAVGDDFLDAPR